MTVVRLKPQDIHQGNLILVNRSHPFLQPATEQPLERVGQVKLTRQAALMFQYVMKKQGFWDKIQTVSGWRSQQEQQQIYQDSLAANGPEFTAQYVALPGCSEHQTGLAIDVGVAGKEVDRIRPDFPYDGYCQRFRETGVEYGFIQRYPAGKEAITGIAHEPWHFRYVGFPHSRLMAEHRLTLEEYIQWLKQYPYGGPALSFFLNGQRVTISYLAADGPPAPQQQDVTIEIPTETPYQVSGNNEDGFILTCWSPQPC